jgi:mono/diheme cytochrome c family protein
MLAYGKNIYDVQCKLCHGPKGNAGVGGAKDLALTQLDETGVGDIVFHGKGAMPPFKERLGEPEINAVAKYVLSLKTK